MEKKDKKFLTVGIPAYNAESTICDVLSSIQTQSIKNEVSVIIANDMPNSNAYDFVLNRYPELDITILTCEKNTGPGLARQRCLDACKTDWITFIDADDVFMGPYSLESLKNNITPNCIEVQGPFFQEIEQGNLSAIDKQQLMQNNMAVPPRVMPRNDVGHPWVFGRLYNVKFLRDNNIEFSPLRAMEDGEINWKIRMTIEGSHYMINRIEDPIYLWRTGSEHSITRIGVEENDGVPIYNWSLCQVGATAASINAIKFCKKANPFNGNVNRFAVEMLIGHYFTCIKCDSEKPLFSKQNYWNAKRFYHSVYAEIENQISDKILKDMYTLQFAAQSRELIGIIPDITFSDFMKKVKEEEYGGKEEFERIRDELPSWVTELEMKSGVLGAEGYIYTIGEKDEN